MNCHFHSMFLAFWKQFGNKSVVKGNIVSFFTGILLKKMAKTLL